MAGLDLLKFELPRAYTVDITASSVLLGHEPLALDAVGDEDDRRRWHSSGLHDHGANCSDEKPEPTRRP